MVAHLPTSGLQNLFSMQELVRMLPQHDSYCEHRGDKAVSLSEGSLIMEICNTTLVPMP